MKEYKECDIYDICQLLHNYKFKEIIKGIKNGLNINSVDREGDNLLMFCNSIDQVQFLIKNGINVNNKDKYGFDALYYKIKHEKLSLLREYHYHLNLLIEYTDIKNYHIQQCIDYNNIDILNILLSKIDENLVNLEDYMFICIDIEKSECYQIVKKFCESRDLKNKLEKQLEVKDVKKSIKRSKI